MRVGEREREGERERGERDGGKKEGVKGGLHVDIVDSWR